jgi:hypothetical protein
VTTIPLEGVEPSHVVLATRAGDRNRLLDAFRRCADTHLPRPEPPPHAVRPQPGAVRQSGHNR